MAVIHANEIIALLASLKPGTRGIEEAIAYESGTTDPLNIMPPSTKTPVHSHELVARSQKLVIR